MKNGFCADEFKEYIDLKKQDRNSEEEARYKELDNKYAGIEVFKGSKSPKEQFEQMNETEDYSNKFAAWFTGTSLNNVKHPEFGKHQLTPEQIKKAPGDYKNKLYKAIKKAFDAGDLEEEIYAQHEQKMSLEDYSKRVKKLVDKATFDDQDFYDHMIDCFIEGKTPEACAKFNESRINEQEAYTKFDLEGSLNESESTWSKLKAITEANRIQVKRKYTEIHPAKYVGKHARVRNEIIKYLGSNQLMTEDEFEDLLLKNAKHPLLWKKRNCDVYEQGEDGYIRLSKKGSRIFGGLNSVNEAESNLEVDLIDVWTIKDKSKLNAVLKYLQTNDVEFEYNPKSLSVEIIDVSNLTPKGLEELQKMLK